MQVHLETFLCKFGGDPAICLGEEAICAKVYRRTDRRTDDGRLAIVLAHSWNELKTRICITNDGVLVEQSINQSIDQTINQSEFLKWSKDYR